MRPIARTVAVAAPVALLLGLAACTSASESARPVDESAVADAAFATCGEASITVDPRASFKAVLAGFLERARTSGCAYGAIRIADVRAKEEARSDALAVARDFVDAFALPWRIEPNVADPTLAANSLKVTLLAAS